MLPTIDVKAMSTLQSALQSWRGCNVKQSFCNFVMNSKGNQITRAGSRKYQWYDTPELVESTLLNLRWPFHTENFIFEPYLELCKMKRESVGAKK